MEYIKLGNTGLDISKICLGCMDLGEKDLYPWHLDEEAGMAYIKNALSLGINFFDTANVYSHGKSEEILGKAIQKYAKRNDEYCSPWSRTDWKSRGTGSKRNGGSESDDHRYQRS